MNILQRQHGLEYPHGPAVNAKGLCGNKARPACSKAVFNACIERAGFKRPDYIAVKQRAAALALRCSDNPVVIVNQNKLKAATGLYSAPEQHLHVGPGQRRFKKLWILLNHAHHTGFHCGKHCSACMRALPNHLFLHDAVYHKAYKRCRKRHKQAEIPEYGCTQADVHDCNILNSRFWVLDLIMLIHHRR